MTRKDKFVTFMDVPRADKLTKAGAAILGIPFESIGHRFRTGSDSGPAAIREQSCLLRPYQPPHADFDPLERLNVVDCGDMDIAAGDVAVAYDSITAAVERILVAQAVPVTLGGDGSVTLPQLRAAARSHGPLALVHIDAHTDTGPGKTPGELSPSTTFTRAAEEGLLDMERAFHVGVRGTQRFEGVIPFSCDLGFEVITGGDLFRRGMSKTGAYLRERIGDRPAYLCFDMDFFDPSCAPGVCQPECGGATAREGLDLLQSLAGMDFAAYDINTVSPPQDIGGMTALLAARVLLECLALACQTRSATS
jgi:agmatinase